jgi:hypothetical protein
VETEQKNFIELALGKIQSDLEHLKTQFNRVEEFTYSLSKKQNAIEKQLSFIRGGFYVFVAVFTIALTLASLK